MPTEGIPTPHFSGTSTTPATTRKLARWLGASAIACACWPLGAAGADATAGVADREGDVVVDPAGPQWKAPHILGASLSYITGADADLTDDVVQGQMRIDASPDPGVQTKLYAGRAMSWRDWRMRLIGSQARLSVGLACWSSGSPTRRMFPTFVRAPHCD